MLQLLQAEAAENRGDRAAALALVDRSLEQDPYIAESHHLKAQLLEAGKDLAGSFEQYRKALELGIAGRDMYLKLVRLALDGLQEPAKAAPYTQWLYNRYGRAEPEIAGLYAAVELRCGRPEEARAVYQRLLAEIAPVPAFALAGLGRIEYDQGNFESAKDLLARALERDGEGRADPGAAAGGWAMDEREVRRLKDDAELKLSKPQEGASVTVSAPAATAGANTQPARILSRVPIRYPWEAQAARVVGNVEVSLLVDEMGQVMKADVVSGDRRLAKAVVESVMRWRFEPQLENGRAVTSRFSVTVTFKPEQKKQ